MAKKRCRLDSHDHGPEFLFSAEVLGPNRVAKNRCLSSSPSQLSLGCEEKSAGTYLEEQSALTPATSLYPETIEWGSEAVRSTIGSFSLSKEEEFNEHAFLGTVGWHDSFIADHSEQQFLRRTLSREAESCCVEDVQVDIDCFLENGDESLYDLPYDPAEVSQGHLHPKLAECFDAVSAAGPEASGVGRIPNGDWFLSDLERDGQYPWKQEVDQEWMQAAVANLDRINDTFDADASMLEFLEAGPVV